MGQPIQPIALDEDGKMRFKENTAVRYLLDNGGLTLSDLFALNLPKEDMIQLMQLIGYSLNGYSELSFVTNEEYYAAQLMGEEGLTEEQAKIQYLEGELKQLRDALRQPMAKLFRVHPDDLDKE